MINFVASFIASKADHWAGDGKKMVGYAFYTLAFLFPLLAFMNSLGGYGLLVIPYVFLCVLCLRKWGAWGELFPDKDNDPLDPKHKWFYRCIDAVFGKSHKLLSDEDLRTWKAIGWGVRYAIYGIPLALLYCYASFSLYPYIIIIAAGLVRGMIYRYGLSQKDLPWCEVMAGGITTLMITGSV